MAGPCYCEGAETCIGLVHRAGPLIIKSYCPIIIFFIAINSEL